MDNLEHLADRLQLLALELGEIEDSINLDDKLQRRIKSIKDRLIKIARTIEQIQERKWKP